MGLRWAVSWLLVLAVGLAPILLYWAGGIIRRFLVRPEVAVGRKASCRQGGGERARVNDTTPADLTSRAP